MRVLRNVSSPTARPLIASSRKAKRHWSRRNIKGKGSMSCLPHSEQKQFRVPPCFCAEQLSDEPRLRRLIFLCHPPRTSFPVLISSWLRSLLMSATLSGLIRRPWPLKSFVLPIYDPARRCCSDTCIAMASGVVRSCPSASGFRPCDLNHKMAATAALCFLLPKRQRPDFTARTGTSLRIGAPNSLNLRNVIHHIKGLAKRLRSVGKHCATRPE